MTVDNISSERKKYLHGKRKAKFLTILAQVSFLAIFVAVWEILARFEVIDSFITSSPSRMFKTFADMLKNGLMTHIAVTCMETLIGFLLGTLLGTLIASLLWWSPFLSKVMSPYLAVLNSLPKVALGPIIIIWVGAGTSAIVTMALAISLIVTIMEVLNGFTATDVNRIKMAESFGASKFQVFTKIVFPSNIPTLLNVLKVSMGLSMVGVITGEFLVSKAGIGYLIVYGGQVFKLDLVMTSVIILAVVATIMYQGIILFQRFINKRGKWQ